MKTKIYKCEKCSTEVNDSQTFCHSCGSQFDASVKYPLEGAKGDEVSIKMSNGDFESGVLIQNPEWNRTEGWYEGVVKLNGKKVSVAYVAQKYWLEVED